MLVNLIAGALLMCALAQHTDTTFAVDPNARLELTNREGSITVRTWDRDEVSVRTNLSYRGALDVQRAGGTVSIGVSRRYRYDDDEIHYRLTVPATMALELRGSDTDVWVDGARGEVDIDVSDGDVTVRGGRGRVTIRTDDGDIDAQEIEGRIRLSSMDGEITVDGASGDIEIDATDGAITLLDIEASNVYANTVDGNIWFDGVLVPRGSYRLTTHDGDVTVLIPEDADAQVSLARHDGEIGTDFPLTVQRWPAGRRIEFSLGNGSAELQIEAFDGDIQLRHRGARRRSR
jgi:DUF4097 and DUF4098 domain-containing protein YvlB